MAETEPIGLDPADFDPRQAYAFFISAWVPRPIAFISTVNEAGQRNLSPFSFFNGVTTDPPILSVSIGRRKGEDKDTARNIKSTREFVVNVVDEALCQKMVLSSADCPPEVDEFEMTGLESTPSTLVKPPRVAASPISMECRLERVLEVGNKKQNLILGEIVRVHVRKDLLKEGTVDAERLKAVGRLGGSFYCRVTDLFSVPRPDPSSKEPSGPGRSGEAPGPLPPH